MVSLLGACGEAHHRRREAVTEQAITGERLQLSRPSETEPVRERENVREAGWNTGEGVDKVLFFQGTALVTYFVQLGSTS